MLTRAKPSNHIERPPVLNTHSPKLPQFFFSTVASLKVNSNVVTEFQKNMGICNIPSPGISMSALPRARVLSAGRGLGTALGR